MLANGSYGKRIIKICETIGIEHDFAVTPENLPVPLHLVKEKLMVMNEKNSFYR